MGLFMSAEERERKKELEQKQVEQFKARVKQELTKMKEVKPDEAERIHERVKELLKEPKLPKDFRKKARELGKKLECEANMRQTDAEIQLALNHAKMDRKKERSQCITEAKKYMRKAVSLGAPDGYRNHASALIENVMLTGNVSNHGKPTRAKPKDKNEPLENRAKSDHDSLFHRKEKTKSKKTGDDKGFLGKIGLS